MLDASGDGERQARRLIGAGLLASVPAALAGSVDWSEQHEQQMRVGVVHAAANTAAMTLYAGSLLARSRRRVALGKALAYAGLAAAAAGGALGGDISFRLAGGANHAEEVPHLVEPGWHDLVPLARLDEDRASRLMLGEVPLLVVKQGCRVHVLADKCAHMSGPLSGRRAGRRVRDLPVARQRVPPRGRERGARAGHRRAARVRDPRPRRASSGLPAGCWLTRPG